MIDWTEADKARRVYLKDLDRLAKAVEQTAGCVDECVDIAWVYNRKFYKVIKALRGRE